MAPEIVCVVGPTACGKTTLGALEGTAGEAEVLAEVKLRSRQYAKRQLTWLRRNPAIHLDLLGKRP